jgi:hypothetical protein
LWPLLLVGIPSWRWPSSVSLVLALLWHLVHY